ncbi:metalloprotease [Entomophthora muscae]|uniref:Metalloprotease n=2 Tax=Entomophthora muscae TaxID=34485 RepID=A0ACC2RRC3_9FUNG|nr:metalloprotease [Entomophthora muscae]
MKRWTVAWWVTGLMWVEAKAGVPYKLIAEVKRKEDSREFCLLELKNKLQVLIEHNPLYDKSILAMDVRAGFRHEPPKRRGMAHLYEHMMHTEEFGAHVVRNLGFSNAETSYEHTVYFFTVASKTFKKSMTRFATMLKHPQFDVRRLKMDVDVVDQEFRDIKRDDAYRLEKVFRATGDETHRYTGYFGGNKTSLIQQNINILQRSLQTVFEVKYSSHRMRLVVMGSAPFSQQIENVVNLFSDIPEYGNDDANEGNPFSKEPRTIEITAASIKDETKLLLQFQLKGTDLIYSDKSELYIAHMLSHRSEGSILSHIKKLGLGFSVSCGVSELNSGFGLFNVEIQLTPRGVNCTKEIIEIVLQGIELLKQYGISPAHLTEMDRVLELQRISEGQMDPLSHAITTARQMHFFDYKSVLNLIVQPKLSSKKINILLDQMSVDNLRVLVSYRDALTDKAEPVFGTNYAVKQIKLQPLARNNGLKLPPPNPFLPTSTLGSMSDGLENYGGSFGIPQRLIVDKSGEMFHLAINSPKSVVFVSFVLGEQLSLENLAMLNLLISIKFETLDEVNYQLFQAGYHISIEPKENRLEFSVWGHNEKMYMVLDRLVAGIFDANIEQPMFEMIKQKEIKNYENQLLEKPIAQAVQALEFALGIKQWFPRHIIQAKEDIQLHHLKNYTANLFKNASLLLYQHGTLSIEEMKKIYRISTRYLNPNTSTELRFKNFLLPDQLAAGSAITLRLKLADALETNSAIAFYLNTFEAKAIKSELLTRMAHHFFKETFVQKIRYEEKLGYNHNIDIFEGPNSSGLLISIQGESHPKYMEERIEHVILGFNKTLAKMSESEFILRRNMLIQYATLNDREDVEARAHWHRISRGFPPIDKSKPPPHN